MLSSFALLAIGLLVQSVMGVFQDADHHAPLTRLKVRDEHAHLGQSIDSSLAEQTSHPINPPIPPLQTLAYSTNSLSTAPTAAGP